MKSNEIYFCPKTGITVEIISGGNGTLSCNGEPMQLMTENTVDAAKEKHIPASGHLFATNRKYAF